MSRKAVGLTIGYLSLVTGIREPSNADDPVNTVSPSATAAALAALTAAMAVLVADGASPTQEHVATADAALTDLNAAWSALLAGTGGIPTARDMLISYDADAVGTRSVLIESIRRLAECAAANSGLPS